jgi:glycerol-3-phosphate O-acyltransferase
MHFKGGKGVASTAGVIATLDWRLIIACLLIFIISVAITKYVSLGSILVMLVMITMTFLLTFAGKMGTKNLGEIRAMSVVLGGLSIFQHRKNIMRLLSGTENKLGSKK